MHWPLERKLPTTGEMFHNLSNFLQSYVGLSHSSWVLHVITLFEHLNSTTSYNNKNYILKDIRVKFGSRRQLNLINS